MTALAGIWTFAGDNRSTDCGRMLEAQHIYAPDPAVRWDGGEVAMGRRLFRTVPEDRYDRGPIVSRDGARVLVADVRLDNRDELKLLLGLDNAQLQSMSDADLLMAAIERWGEDAVTRLVGDFAFALWDSRERRLLLARDFLGQRPLHFHRAPGFFAFASMPKGLHALPDIPRMPDEPAVGRFLLLMPETGTDSYFRQVERVPAGHVCVVTRGKVSLRRSWNPERTMLRLNDPAEYDEAVRECFDRAVADRLRGTEGRVATHLSGGLDSSAVTATAARLIGPDGAITAFTSVPREGYQGVDPRGRFSDEGAHAAGVAALYPQVEHVLVRAGQASPVASLDRYFHLYERPFLNLCNGTWWDAIGDAAKARGLRVLLTGQSGNMSFSYSGLELLPDLLAKGRVGALARQFGGLRRHGVRIESALSHMIGPFLPPGLWRAVNRLRGRHLDIRDYSAVRPGLARAMLKDAAAAGLDPAYRPRRDPFATRLWVLQRVDVGNYNKGQLGGWGLDVRDPTADRRLVELCLSIPTEQYLRDGQPRALARSAFADRLPPQVVRESRKGLQAVDWHEGLDQAREQVAGEVERLSRIDAAADIFDLPGMATLIHDWPRGQWNSDKVSRLYRLALLRGVSAGHFLRKALGSNV